MKVLIRALAVLAMVLPSAFVVGGSALAQDEGVDARSIIATLQERGASSEAEGLAYWNSLSSNQQAAAAELMNDVTVTVDDEAAPSAMMANCNTQTASVSFNYAGGTIWGGTVYQTISWCYDTSGTGIITSNSCSAGHDQMFPFSFTGWSRYCELVAGGNGYQSVDRRTQGGFINISGWGIYPCVGTVGDAFGNYWHYNC